MAKKWFFKRGNARVSWETVPEWAQFVAVESYGAVYAYKNRPTVGFVTWVACGDYNPIAHVGHECADWESLIFERPQPQPRVVITPEEAAAIRMLFPGAIGVAKDKDGAVYAFNGAPEIGKTAWWGIRGQSTHYHFPFLNARFADIPLHESWTLLPGC